MTLLPIFNAQIELDANQLSFEEIPRAYFYNNKYIDINGVRTKLETKVQNKYKLSRLICFLNLEEPRKILRGENVNKANLIEPFSLTSQPKTPQVKIVANCVVHQI